jgi:uncharacterized membrane protein
MRRRPHPLSDIFPGTSLLPIPFALSLLACAMFAATMALDIAAARGAFTLPAWLSVGNVDDARTLLGAFLGAVSTVLALIFSVSLLVFSAAATQFGPRLMYRFLGDRMMQVTLGLFVATFLHATLTLIAVRDQGSLLLFVSQSFVPQLTVLTTCALVVVSFACLVVFNNNIASSIQTNNVLPRIVDDLKVALAEVSDLVTEQARRSGGTPRISGQFRTNDVAELRQLCATDGAIVRSAFSGFVQTIQHERLISGAARADAVVRLLFRPGHFVREGDTIARVLPAQAGEAMAPVVLGAVQVGRHRNLEQDLEFAIAQLVEIALRALSPAINDTYTGLYCIDWLGDGIRGLAHLPKLDGAWCSDKGEVRLLLPPMHFRDIVKTAFDSIRQASSGNAAVKIRLLSTWTALAPHLSTPAQNQALLEQANAIWEFASQEAMAAMDRAEIKVAYDEAVVSLSA